MVCKIIAPRHFTLARGVARFTKFLYKIQEFYQSFQQSRGGNKAVNKAVKEAANRAANPGGSAGSASSSPTNAPDFLLHDDRDDAGVVVVEGVEAGRVLSGWSMEADRTVEIKTLDPIPLGHKVALRDIATGDDVIKYGEVIGQAVSDIPAGSHLHVHNTKTKKW